MHSRVRPPTVPPTIAPTFSPGFGVPVTVAVGEGTVAEEVVLTRAIVEVAVVSDVVLDGGPLIPVNMGRPSGAVVSPAEVK